MADVIAVFGPTASGKSAAALDLASELDGEIVSCDAMQLYRGLPILTNQPTADELAAAPHHLVGVWPLDHEGSVAEYAEMAQAAIAAVVRERIERRTREMFERGVEEEVRVAVAGRLSSTARRIHGLQDVTALLAGEIDREEAIRRLDARTRRYAKRQRVWMRRLPGLVPISSAAEMIDQVK